MPHHASAEVFPPPHPSRFVPGEVHACCVRAGSRSLVLHAVKICSAIFSDPSLINRYTAAAWCPIFSKVQVCGEIGAGLLEEFPPTLNWRLTRTMNKDDFKKILDRVGDSGPGKDGLPYSAWRASGEFGVDILFQAAQSLASGELPPAWFNDSLMIFAQKKSRPSVPNLLLLNPWKLVL